MPDPDRSMCARHTAASTLLTRSTRLLAHPRASSVLSSSPDLETRVRRATLALSERRAPLISPMDKRRDIAGRRKSNMGLDLLASDWQGLKSKPERPALITEGSDASALGRSTRSMTAEEVLEDITAVPRAEWSDVKEPAFVGCGAFANVFVASFGENEVAVKILKQECREDPLAQKDLASEAELLSRLVHPHIPTLHAVGENDGAAFIVMQRLAGTLSEVLPPPKDNVPIWTWRAAVRAWPLSRAVEHGVALAAALAYCHDDAIAGVGVMHRDLKPDNIGFAADDGRLVLFDFGLAKLLPREPDGAPPPARAMTGETGSTRYMAPEVALAKPYAFPAEVFSWSLILWQMAAHEKPFGALTVAAHGDRVAKGGLRPPLRPGWPAPFCALLTECWKADAAERPRFAELLPRLKQIQDEAREREAAAGPPGGGCCLLQ